MDWKISSICRTCLSNKRLLYPLLKFTQALDCLGILVKIDESSGICWECKSIMQRFIRFKNQVVKAQNALNQIVKHQDLKCLSTLSRQDKFIYDLEIQHCDPLTYIEPDENKIDVKDVKEESNSEIFIDERISDYDVGITDLEENGKCEDISYKNNLETEIKDKVKKMKPLKTENFRKAKLLKSKKHSARKRSKVESKLLVNSKNKLEDEEVKAKFTTVVFTEEEMLRNREEKRSQPNFKKIPYKCDSCVLGFTRRDTYNLHVEKKHDENIGTYICDVCQSRFSTSNSLERHRRKHYVLYRCRLCEYESLELWSAASHCRVKHSGDTRGRIHCPQCSTIVRSPEALSEHIRTLHTLCCNECGDKFKGKHTLRTHKIRIHGANRDFVCDVCGKTFKTKSRLESHVIGHNSTLAKKLAYCNICNVQYKNIYVYRNHLKNSANHSERVYECTECNKKFASKVYWRKHCDFYHLKKSQYKCEICNKLFISDWRLKNHRQTHHGLSRSRNHTCNTCGKKFFTLSTLRGHQLTHSEQRTYMCEDCGDTFKQRPALYTHSRLVHQGGKRRK